MSFDIKDCQLLYFGPHSAVAGRSSGVVRVAIEEEFMGNTTRYQLDLKVKASTTRDMALTEVRTALLAHAAHQLNRLKTRRTNLAAAE